MSAEKITQVVAYLGRDKGYWNNLIAKIRAYFSGEGLLELKFSHLFEEDEKKHYALVQRILRENINVLFVDLSAQVTQNLFLIKHLRKVNRLRGVLVIALSDPLTKQETYIQSFLSGAFMNHVKGTELHDVVYNMAHFSIPSLAGEPAFAKAENFEQRLAIYEAARVNFYAEDKLEIEINSPLPEGDELEIVHQIPERAVSASMFGVREIDTKDFYYNAKRKYQLDIKYVDDFIKIKRKVIYDEEGQAVSIEDLPKGSFAMASVVEIEEKRDLPADKVEKALVKSKQDYLDWIADNRSRSVPKFTKIMILDKDLKFFTSQNNIFHHQKFVIRTQSRMQDVGDELLKQMPNIIAIDYETKKKAMSSQERQQEREGREADEMEQKDVAGNLAPTLEDIEVQDHEENRPDVVRNDLNLVKKIIKGIGQLADYEPFIVIFNIKELAQDGRTITSKAIQEQFSYPNIMIQYDPIDFNIVFNFGEAYEKKYSVEHPDNTFYPDKNSSYSYLQVRRDIVLVYMTESDIYFRSETALTLYSVHRVELPVRHYITVVPHLPGSSLSNDASLYKGLIHGVNEEQKREIRRHVNSIIGKDQAIKNEQDRIEQVKANLKVIEEKEQFEKAQETPTKTDTSPEKVEEEVSEPPKEEKVPEELQTEKLEEKAQEKNMVGKTKTNYNVIGGAMTWRKKTEEDSPLTDEADEEKKKKPS